MRQFKGLANNYNQITRAIHKAFTEKKARYLLAELKTITAAMSENMQKVIDLTDEAKAKW